MPIFPDGSHKKHMPSGKSHVFPDGNSFYSYFAWQQVPFYTKRLLETVDYSIGMITDVGYFFPVQTFWEATLVFVCSDQTPG